ncbi:unnamed protein product [Cladocopium goreaui]|uniref:Uncharacterized protein n=1 Tax=Cladocopium goreaui TaxID=2562237 RepID=A0A9P1GER0_9DINO|nr:unnamed protein product [Cladocopium goreaui]
MVGLRLVFSSGFDRWMACANRLATSCKHCVKVPISCAMEAEACDVPCPFVSHQPILVMGKTKGLNMFKIEADVSASTSFLQCGDGRYTEFGLRAARPQVKPGRHMIESYIFPQQRYRRFLEPSFVPRYADTLLLALTSCFANPPAVPCSEGCRYTLQVPARDHLQSVPRQINE